MNRQIDRVKPGIKVSTWVAVICGIAGGFAILFCIALVMRDFRPSSVTETQAKQFDLTSIEDLRDFADHPEKWKGRTIKASMYCSGSWSDMKGMRFDSRFKLIDTWVKLDSPVNVSMPNTNDFVTVEFICEDGRTNRGNKISKVDWK